MESPTAMGSPQTGCQLYRARNSTIFWNTFVLELITNFGSVCTLNSSARASSLFFFPAATLQPTYPKHRSYGRFCRPNLCREVFPPYHNPPSASVRGQPSAYYTGLPWVTSTVKRVRSWLTLRPPTRSSKRHQSEDCIKK
eukprot:3628660-Amphidinium_carterae.1